VFPPAKSRRPRQPEDRIDPLADPEGAQLRLGGIADDYAAPGVEQSVPDRIEARSKPLADEVHAALEDALVLSSFGPNGWLEDKEEPPEAVFEPKLDGLDPL
jgi:hypothetical protein